LPLVFAVSIGLISQRRNPNLCLEEGTGTRNAELASVMTHGDGGMKFESVVLRLLLFRDSVVIWSRDKEVGQGDAQPSDRRAVHRQRDLDSIFFFFFLSFFLFVFFFFLGGGGGATIGTFDKLIVVCSK
jgi:hypothetical protein